MGADRPGATRYIPLMRSLVLALIFASHVAAAEPPLPEPVVPESGLIDAPAADAPPDEPQAKTTIVVTAVPVTLHRTPTTGAERLGSLEYLGGLELDSADPRFGGLSGMVLIDGGGALLAVSDNGTLLHMPLQRDGSGRLTGVGPVKALRIDSAGGKSLARGEGDSEEIQLLPDGRVLIAFEQHHRLATVGRVDALTSAIEAPFPTPKGIQLAPKNGGLEAVLAQKSGGVFAIREKPLDHLGKHAAWLIHEKPERIDAVTYRTADGFQPTALALDAGGAVLALERRFTLLDGIAARVVRFPQAAITPNGEITTTEVGRFAAEHICDNFEALATAPMTGGTRVLIASDDNFNPGQHTYLLEFFSRSSK